MGQPHSAEPESRAVQHMARAVEVVFPDFSTVMLTVLSGALRG
jgi:hypothetical protein